MQGHAHWINTLALSTDYVLRTGAFEPADFGRPLKVCTPEEERIKAQDRYDSVRRIGPERLVSGSDDFTLFLWNPEKDNKPLGIRNINNHSYVINQSLMSSNVLNSTHDGPPAAH